MKSTNQELPFSSPEFLESWQDWTEFRKELKEPITPTAFKRQIRFLRELGEQAAIASINQSIVAGWRGLFPVAKAMTTCKTVHFTQHTPGSGF